MKTKDRREIWMLDLQEEFDKIYDSITSVLNVSEKVKSSMTNEERI